MATIRIGNLLGTPFHLESGVPQGACLSPSLFNFYVSDLPDTLPDTDYVQYADDVTQIISGKHIESGPKLAHIQLNVSSYLAPLIFI